MSIFRDRSEELAHIYAQREKLRQEIISAPDTIQAYERSLEIMKRMDELEARRRELEGLPPAPPKGDD
jgi:hypothetical protein